MKKLLPVVIALALIGGSPMPPPLRAQAIPASFFSVHVNNLSSWPLGVPYGGYRDWDSNMTSWAQTNTASGSFNWTNLDANLSKLYSQGIKDGLMYTMSRTPSWASSSPTDATCGYGKGQCDPSTDQNANGTCNGTNSVCNIWDAWVTAIATHVNNSTYEQTHAHIKYWEPQNEIFCDSVISSVCPGNTKLTYAEVLRQLEDTRCIILGVGTIHNFPTAGSSSPCSTLLSDLGQSAIDPNAKITLDGNPNPGQQYALQNIMYCNASPGTRGGGTDTSCTWAPASGNVANCNSSSCWGAAALDIQNLHLYVTNEEPEKDLPAGSTNNFIGSWESKLASSDASKPLFNGEGSCGYPNTGAHIWGNTPTGGVPDTYSVAAFIVRFSALLWSSGVSVDEWYSDDNSCALNTSVPTEAWTQAYDWMVGSTPVNSPFCSASGTVWTCAMTEASGKASELVWDSQYGPGGTASPSDCTTASVPTICGSTSYTVPAAYTGPWTDITGASHAHASPVTIGAVPILLEATPPASPTVTGVSPTSGAANGGTYITITGTNFDNNSLGVLVGGDPCGSANAASSTSITCVTPPNPVGPAEVSVTDDNGTGSLNNAFTYAYSGSGSGGSGAAEVCNGYGPTYCAPTDHRYVLSAAANAPAAGGGLFGAGTVFIDQNFGSRLVRLTDVSTEGLNTTGDGQNFLGDCSGSAEASQFSLNDDYIAVCDNGGAIDILQFNPATLAVGHLDSAYYTSTAGLRLSGEFAGWSRVTDALIYNGQVASSDAEIESYNVSGAPPISGTLVSNLSTATSCIGTQSGAPTINVTPNDQQIDGWDGNYMFVWDVTNGCRWWDLNTATIGGAWGTTGSVTGSTTSAIHNAQISQNGTTFRVEGVSTNFVGLWPISGITITSCNNGSTCEGHIANGSADIVSQGNQNIAFQEDIAPFSAPTTVTHLVTAGAYQALPAGCSDETHQSWSNSASATDSVQPLFATSMTQGCTVGTNNGADPVPLSDEVKAFSVQQQNLVYRFARHWATGASQYFASQQAIGNISADGKYYMFSSDWGGTLGNSTYASIASWSRTSNVVTVTTASVKGALSNWVAGDTIRILDASPGASTSINGTFTLASETSTTFTFNQTAANDSSATASGMAYDQNCVVNISTGTCRADAYLVELK